MNSSQHNDRQELKPKNQTKDDAVSLLNETPTAALDKASGPPISPLTQSEAEKIIAHKLEKTPKLKELLDSLMCMQSQPKYRGGVSTKKLWEMNDRNDFIKKSSIGNHLGALRKASGGRDDLIIRTLRGQVSFWLLSELGLKAFQTVCPDRKIEDEETA